MTEAVANPQEFTFQAEIKQVLHILSHSLYQNREIALRELISNASDSLNKLRYIQLTEEKYRDDQPLGISLEIETDGDQKILSIVDNGIGLTRDELIQNLGTIARSGSKEFLSHLKGDENNALSLIGQFGVGFYSSFMLADRVEVITRSYQEETGWKWESDGSGAFQITPVAESLPRGARIRLVLKSDNQEFTDEHRLGDVIRRYSTFVPFPVRLGDAVLNEQKPIWVEPKSQLSDLQYEEFYRWISHHSGEKPLWRLHFSSDTPLQFHAILFAPPTNMEKLGFGRMEHGISLCAKRILVQDDSRDLLPEYLDFLYGLVDSADLPLNVSRETLQDHTIIPKLKKILTRKVLDELAAYSKDNVEGYKKFIAEWGPSIRTGIATDWDNRERIGRLLRFQSTRSQDADQFISLEDYLQTAPEGQEQIYYLSGPHRDSLVKHPHLESFRRKGLEVLLLTDPIDEYALVQLRSFEGKDFISIDSADIKFPASTEVEQPEQPANPAGITRVIELFRGALSDTVSDVRESSRLFDSPACLVNPSGSMSAQLERALHRAQAEVPITKKILEVNPQALLLQKLASLSPDSSQDDFIRECGRQLYANALMLDGVIVDPHETAARSLHFMEELANGRQGTTPQ